MASKKSKKPVESESEEETEPIERGNSRRSEDSESEDDLIAQLEKERKTEAKSAKKAAPKSKKQVEPETSEEEDNTDEEESEGSEDDFEEPQPKIKGKKLVEKEVVPYAYQVKHVTKLEDILSDPLPPVPGKEKQTSDDIMMGVIDRSPPGSGKTVTTLKIKQDFGLDIVILVPSEEIRANWNVEGNRYNIPFKGVYTYSSLVGTAPRGKKTGSYVPASGLLERNLGVKKRGLGRTKKEMAGEVEEVFSARPKLMKLIRGRKNEDGETIGTLFVFDEAHKATGTASLTSQAVMKIIELITYDPDSNSRYMLLSGSLFEKYENLIALLRVMGIMRSYFMVNTRTGEPAALGELMDFARRFDDKKVRDLVKAAGSKIYSRGQKQKDFVFALYEKIIQPNISSAMPNLDVTLKINHLEYLKRDEVIRVGGALNLMHKTIEYEGKATAQLQKMVIMDIQAGLAPALARFTERMLTEYPHLKMVLFYQYNEARDILKKALKKYKPLIIAGQTTTSLEERAAAIKKFNAPNDKHRVILVSILVGALGIQLDDKVGGYMHRAAILPVWSLKLGMQAADRVGRADTFWGGTNNMAERKPGQEDAVDRPRAYFFYAANATGPDPESDSMINLMKKAITKGKMLGVAMQGESGKIPVMPDSFAIEYQTPAPENKELYPPLNTELGRLLREEAEKKSQAAFADVLEGRGIELGDDEEDFAEDSEEETKPKRGKPKAAAKKKTAASRSRSTKKDESESEEESEEEEKPKPKSKKAAAKKAAASRSRSTKKDESESEEESEEEKPKPKSKKAGAKKTPAKTDDSDSEEEPKPKSKKAGAKKTPAKTDDSDEDEPVSKPKITTSKPVSKPSTTKSGASGLKTSA